MKILKTVFFSVFAHFCMFGGMIPTALADCPCSIWASNVTPQNASVNDPNGVELGVKFRATVDGAITGIRFYKGVGNTGTHVGSLWSSDGNLLAQATFSNETETGWQQVNFTSPVQISASSTYVASYYAPQGRYSGDNDYFASQGVENGPLAVDSNVASGGNGVYAYGSASTFPNASFRATNYWVDVVFTTSAVPPLAGGIPVLHVTTQGNKFTQYYSEILLAEGLNEFTTVDIANVSSSVLSAYDVVVLGEMALSTEQVSMFTSWVNAGGNLIAMRPDKKLAGLLGLADASGTLAEGYILANTASGPGVGIVNQTIQYHGSADLYTLNGAATIAELYADALTDTGSPAVTLRSVGTNGGQAAAFVYDLARSVVYTRQGNPAWVGQERDGIPAIRANDLFFPDYVNLNKVAIPQADEQQRLLANLIIQMNLDNKPLPRFWYLPAGVKAAIVHTLDDHNTSIGTKDTFNKLAAMSPADCSAEDWQCFRATSWVYTGVNLTDAEAASYNAQGFELGVHAQNGCTVNFTSFAELDLAYKNDLQQFRALFPSVPPQATSRFHCIVWSDWVTQARVQLANGIRYNMDYYYYPDSWLQGRPGLFTGSGLPMRFADLDGEIIDVYQGVSQLVNENGLSYPTATNAMLDKALGPEGYYGLFGTHDDYRETGFLDKVIQSAQSRNVPIISARQALNWLDGRNTSSFSAVSWSGNNLSFSVNAGSGARNLQAMLPINSATHSLTALSRGGLPVSFTTQTIKGIAYAFFTATSGSYLATYNGEIVIPPNPSSGITIWPATTTPTVASFVGDSSSVELGVKFVSERAGLISGIRFYKGETNTGTHIGNLWTSSGTLLATATFSNETSAGWQEVKFATPVDIEANVTYVASYFAPNGNYAVDANYFANEFIATPLIALSSGTSGGNGLYRYGESGFPTSSYNATNYWVDVVFADYPPEAAITIWPPTTTPAIASFVGDSSAVELGVKFQSERAGLISGVRFYKGETNTGTHIGNLWTSTGTLIASATFSNETASGWQEVKFATPVDIEANVTYVASYFAPNGNYAVDANYFANEFTAAPLKALSSGASGGNGLYRYGPTGFPNSSYNATNYWVDVVFEDQASPPPPQVGVSIWPSTTTPAIASFVGDSSPIELGVKFAADRAGFISGIRFYKGATNTGTHVGNLWTSTGALLSSATFSTETATGWQEVRFAEPVAIDANVTYVASYFAPNGNYAVNSNYFANEFSNGPLKAFASGASGGNGVYSYGLGGFPDATYNGNNYWVDVVFEE